MRLIAVLPPPRPILRWTQRLLTLGGLTSLGYCGFVLGDAWFFGWRQGRLLDELRAPGRVVDARTSDSLAPSLPPAGETPSSASEPVMPAPVVTDIVGRLRVARLGLSAIILEGTSAATLRRAVGHMPGTALPGEAGNVAISGHRDTHFRPLRNIRRDDLIALTTLHGDFRYRVVSTLIVSPDYVAVLDPGEGENLTLITCYPFRFVGAAPERFIVQAKRVP